MLAIICYDTVPWGLLFWDFPFLIFLFFLVFLGFFLSDTEKVNTMKYKEVQKRK